MQLPDSIKQHLSKEFRFIATRLTKTTSLETKLYFFSAFYGEANRALNYYWDSELALLHLVLQSVHQQITARMGALSRRAERPVAIPNELIPALDQVALDLATLFELEKMDSQMLYKILCRISELGYSATGNGYYLYTKGELKI